MEQAAAAAIRDLSSVSCEPSAWCAKLKRINGSGLSDRAAATLLNNCSNTTVSGAAQSGCQTHVPAPVSRAVMIGFGV